MGYGAGHFAIRAAGSKGDTRKIGGNFGLHRQGAQRWRYSVFSADYLNLLCKHALRAVVPAGRLFRCTRRSRPMGRCLRRASGLLAGTLQDAGRQGSPLRSPAFRFEPFEACPPFPPRRVLRWGLSDNTRRAYSQRGRMHRFQGAAVQREGPPKSGLFSPLKAFQALSQVF